MAQYKEIVTKAVIGKGKKSFKNSYNLSVDSPVDTVLGCWVINHNLFGTNVNGNVLIKGNFDVNIWYSYEGNTKTNVATSKVNYEEKVSINLKDSETLTDNCEIIIRSLRNPNCVDVKVNGNSINYDIEKELGIEIIGDTKVRIVAEDEADDYDLIEDVNIDEINSEIDKEVNEEFLNESE